MGQGRGGFPDLKKPNFSHLFMGEFELSNNLSQMRSNFTRPENAKFISFARLQFTTAMHAPCLAVHELRVKILRRKTMDPLVLRWPLALDLLQVPTRKVCGGGLVSLTKGVLSEQTKKQVLRFQAAKLQCISLCTHTYICKDIVYIYTQFAVLHLSCLNSVWCTLKLAIGTKIEFSNSTMSNFVL